MIETSKPPIRTFFITNAVIADGIKTIMQGVKTFFAYVFIER
jgi:hypothetical protein